MHSGGVLLLACPACAQALEATAYDGWLWGMGLMMVTPFLLLAVVGGGIVHAARRARREQVERFIEAEEDRREAGARRLGPEE